MNTTPQFIDVLLDPSLYPEPTASVELVQTHISWVFITDTHAYKIKKPVDFGFLDFTTLEKRRHFVEEELRLNRRLCPEIYLDCVPLVQTGANRFSLGGKDGRVVEWVLKMAKMPQEGMMQGLIQREELDTHHMDLLMGRLVPFYDSAATGGRVDEYGAPGMIKFNIEENFEQTAHFLDTILDREKYEFIRAYNKTFFHENMGLFARRITRHRIREGHGDLYSANICFDREKDSVYCFDCIEFNERFRCGDVACDLGFLAMDLDFHGLPWMEQYLVEGFRTASNDDELICLMDFYKCYRAYVRAKISCFMAADSGIPGDCRERAKADARDYLMLAYRYAGGMKGVVPIVYCFMGFSGTGKSSLARDFSKKMGIKTFNSDIVRKEVVLGIPKDERHQEPFGQGIYSEDVSRRTYASLRRHAAREAMLGRSVALDATYTDHEERKRLLELEAQGICRVIFIHCELDEDTVMKRLEKRMKEGGGPSDASYEIYLEQKKRFVPFDQDTFHHRVVVMDTRGSRAENLEALSRLLEAKGI